MFDDSPSTAPRHQHTPGCGSHRHSSSSLPSNTCVTSKNTCLHSHLPCGHKDPLVKSSLVPSSLTGVPLQHLGPCHKHKLDTSSSFPYQAPQQQNWAKNEHTTMHSVKLPCVLTGGLAATAVPLGAPCIMPSPFYDELDSKTSLLSASYMTEQRQSSAKWEQKLEERAVADIGLQTSFHSQSENSTGSKCQQSLPASTQAIDEEVLLLCHSLVSSCTLKGWEWAWGQGYLYHILPITV